jgi:hypothetical protein
MVSMGVIYSGKYYAIAAVGLHLSFFVVEL